MTGKKQIVLDTNIFMESLDVLKKLVKEYEVVIPMIVLEELDNLKDSNGDYRRHKARHAIKFIHNNYDKVSFDTVEYQGKPDNQIIRVAKVYECALATNDICMKVKANREGLEVIDVHKTEVVSDYQGYKEVYIDSEDDNIKLADVYQNKNSNPFGLKLGEYLIVKNEIGEVKDKMKMTSDGTVGFYDKMIKSKYFGNVKPIDEYQSCLIDSLINNNLTMVRGKSGSGKSLLSLAYAINMLESGKYSKLIILSNPVGSRNSAKLGFYPGTRTEKILDTFVGSMLSSKLGGIEGVYQLIDSGKLEILPFSDIRGYDTTGMNAIVYIVEAQNLDVDLMKLAIQRVSDDCKLIIDGDNNSQVDMWAYEGDNNGMARVSEVFRGREGYGEVELKCIHRSEMARIADEM